MDNEELSIDFNHSESLNGNYSLEILVDVLTKIFVVVIRGNITNISVIPEL